MNIRNPMKRRMLLRAILLGATAGVSARALAFSARGTLVVTPGLAERATQCVSDDRFVGELGACYLADSNEEGSVPFLLERIGERWPAGTTDLVGLPSHSLRRALASIALRDFEQADVVLVDGWVLARSEARLYAVAYMVRREGN